MHKNSKITTDVWIALSFQEIMNAENASEIEADNDAVSDGVAFIPFFPLLQVWCFQFSWRGEPRELHEVDVRQLLRCSRQIFGYSPLPWERALDGGMQARKAPCLWFQSGSGGGECGRRSSAGAGVVQHKRFNEGLRERRQITGKLKQSVHFSQITKNVHYRIKNERHFLYSPPPRLTKMHSAKKENLSCVNTTRFFSETQMWGPKKAEGEPMPTYLNINAPKFLKIAYFTITLLTHTLAYMNIYNDPASYLDT